jgi:predicted nucleotidyltransferase
MRLNAEIAAYLRQLIRKKIPGSTVYLFGSRVNDQARGGDIDLMILTDHPADKRLFRQIRTEFFKKIWLEKN